ncbi:NosL family protein [haloarchaeon 3A1-DGR]|nr:NosL family protein [haloarchaeon 3A1-DGR]
MVNRRRFLTASAAIGGVGSTAGCLDRLSAGSADAEPDPVDLSGGTFDDDHGMEIGPHGGANGQIYYANHAPPDREGGPFWFHTLVFSLFPFHFDRLDRGWEPEIIYVTDFSTVDWTIEDRESGPTMPSPTAPETFGDATTLTYVVESDVRGGMGPGLHPFSEADEAAAFVDDHGGRTIGFDDIDRVLVQGLRDGE